MGYRWTRRRGEIGGWGVGDGSVDVGIWVGKGGGKDKEVVKAWLGLWGGAGGGLVEKRERERWEKWKGGFGLMLRKKAGWSCWLGMFRMFGWGLVAV